LATGAYARARGDGGVITGDEGVGAVTAPGRHRRARALSPTPRLHLGNLAEEFGRRVVPLREASPRGSAEDSPGVSVPPPPYPSGFSLTRRGRLAMLSSTEGGSRGFAIAYPNGN
jgi:hypothetical protein